MALTGTVRASNADCKCEHGYVEGIGWTNHRCVRDAWYYNYDEKKYLCSVHAEPTSIPSR